MKGTEKQITSAPHGHILTNTAVWSPDSGRIVYDVRSDAEGSKFDGTRIETVDVQSGEVRTLYESKNGACCGVATFHPTKDRVVFILGPEHPTPDWSYGPSHRQGVIVDAAKPGVAIPLDARDLVPPFTAGALRGGSHVHVFSPDGARVSFTYDDHVLAELPVNRDAAKRNVGVSLVDHPVTVPATHPRNHSGSAFSVLVTHTSMRPRAGSDEYLRAYEEGWVGTEGYLRRDRTRQRWAIAFVGDVPAADGKTVAEAFVVDLPEDLTQPGDGPLAGTATRLPSPPRGTAVRRLSRTIDRKFPGIQGPRHWLRSSPDGASIATLMRDDKGIVQIFTISPEGGEPHQLTHNAHDIASAFTWSRDGRWIAHAMDNSVCVTDAQHGQTHRLTPRSADADAPLPMACVFSPDGRRIACQRHVTHKDGNRYNQIFVIELEAVER